MSPERIAIEELVNIFTDRDSADELLDRIDYPRSRRPVFSLSPEVFWRSAIREIELGIIPGGLERLLAEAATLYPGNRALASWKPVLSRSSSEVKGTKDFLVPFSRNPFFTGREGLLAELYRTLTDKAGGHVQLNGPSGVGKTQTVVEYAYRFRDHYRTVLFVRSDTTAALISSFTEIALHLQLDEPNEPERLVDDVLSWLADNQRWLLIFDNVDTSELLKPFLPAPHRGHVLLTSRSRALGAWAAVPALMMPTLSTDESVNFLLSRAGRETAEPEQRRAAVKLAESLGLCPLALEQAGAYLSVHGVSFQSYLESYRKHCRESLVDPLAAICSMSLREVEEMSPAAVDLLRASAFFSPDDIPLELITRGATKLGDVLTAALAEAEDGLLVIEDLMDILTHYSLIQQDIKAQSFSVHPLVQTIVEQTLDGADQRLWSKRVIRALEQVFPDQIYQVIDPSNWLLCERLLSQATVGAEWVRAFSLNLHEAGRLFNEVASYLQHRARYTEAERFLRQALGIYESALGENHPGVATTLANLGNLYRAQERLAEAESLFQRALRIRNSVLGVDHPNVAITLTNLANLYRAQDRLGEAEPMYERALEIWQKAFGDDHLQVVASLDDLANLYRVQGRYDKAESLYLRTLEIRERLLGKEHPEIATTLNELSTLYYDQSRYKEVEALLQRVLEIWQITLGSEHSYVATTLVSLADLYGTLSRYSEAEQSYQRALGNREQALGKSHPDIAAILTSLGSLYLVQGLYSKAELPCHRALEITENSLGSRYPEAATALRNLGLVYLAQGRFGEAEPLYRRALEITEKALESDHPEVGIVLDNLATLLRAQGRYEEAELLYRRALRITEEALGGEDLETAKRLEGLAVVLHDQGRQDEVETLYRRALAIKESTLGGNHPDMAKAMGGLASLYHDQGRHDEAEPLHRRVLEIAEHAPEKDKILASLRGDELKRAALSREFRAVADHNVLWLPPDATAPLLILGFVQAARYMTAAQKASIPHHRLGHLERAEKILGGLEIQFLESHSVQTSALGPALRAWHNTFSDLQRTARKRAAEQLPNPFRAGEPLSPELGHEVFRGREPLVRKIETLLADPHHSSSLALLGPRRCGKTSLLKMLPTLLPDAVCIFFDLQDNPVDSPASFFQALARCTREEAQRQRRLKLPELPAGTPFESGSRWLELVENAAGDWRVLICIDEFEKLEGLFPGSKRELLQLMGLFRATIQHRRKVRLLVSGEAPFDELNTLWSDHFINLREIRLGHLDAVTARDLIQRPIPEFPEDAIPTTVADDVIRRTGGQPYLLQLYAYHLILLLNDTNRRQARCSDIEHVEEEVLSEATYYFSNTWLRAPSAAREMLLALAVGADPMKDRKAVRWLRRRSLLSKKGDLAIPVLGRWIREEELE
jgi:tetratricopeptide (TPR) repeat protein